MGLILAGAMTVASGLSQYGQSKAQAQAYSNQAKVDEQNAQIAERQRELVNEQSMAEQRKLLARKKLIAGQNAAAMGAGGVDSMSGTAADLRLANEEVYQQDRQTLDSNLRNSDWELRQNIANYEQSAKANRSAAKSTKRAGLFNSILSTAVGLYGLRGMASATKATSSTSGLGTDYTKLFGGLNTKGDPYRNTKLYNWGGSLF